MSRLRQPFLYNRYIFVMVNHLRSRAKLDDADFGCLARTLARMRLKHGFILTAWVFLPNRWHALIYPPHPVSISRVLQAVKVSSTVLINLRRQEAGEQGHGIFFMRGLVTFRLEKTTGQEASRGHLTQSLNAALNRAASRRF